MRTVRPIGSSVPKRFVATVWPMMQTFVFRISSVVVQSDPLATENLRMGK